MKKPIWEESTGSLVAWLLVNTKAMPIDLWTITRQDGTILRYTSGDVAVTVAGFTFNVGPHFQRSAVMQRIGVSVDTLEVEVTSDDRYTLSGVPFLQSVAKGALLGAKLALWRVFLDLDFNAKGVVGVFYGTIGDVSNATRHSCNMQVRSFLELLNVMVPGDVYQTGCRNRLFDVRCKLPEASWRAVGITDTDMDDTKRVITSSTAAIVAKPSGWAGLGTLYITSGPNAGLSRNIRFYDNPGGTVTITAVWPFPFRSLSGNGFYVTAGCDKRQSTCETKFNNKPNFRGEPFVPPPESVL